MSSFAVSCFTVFPTVSIGSAIMAFSPWLPADAARDDPAASARHQSASCSDRRHHRIGTTRPVRSDSLPLLWRGPAHHHSDTAPMARAIIALA